MKITTIHLRAITALSVLLPATAHAQLFSSADRVGKGILDFLTGGFGVTVGGIAIAAFGFLATTGRISWPFAIAVIVGLVCIFGGAQFAEEIQSMAA